jgi:hypothetical protein
MLHHVAFVRTDVLEARMTIIIRVDSASGNNVRMMVVMCSSETSVSFLQEQHGVTSQKMEIFITLYNFVYCRVIA